MKSIDSVQILEDAAEDLAAGKRFYDACEEGVGRYFFDCLVTDIESLRIYGGIHGVEFGFHRLLSKRFPFAIYYDLEGSTARVAAVLDMRRDPAWIRTELQKRADQ
ncbi:MAG: type II toxin-antitoxin system RelE/ParE family toxin [Opitutales bacterium]